MGTAHRPSALDAAKRAHEPRKGRESEADRCAVIPRTYSLTSPTYLSVACTHHELAKVPGSTRSSTCTLASAAGFAAYPVPAPSSASKPPRLRSVHCPVSKYKIQQQACAINQHRPTPFISFSLGNIRANRIVVCC